MNKKQLRKKLALMLANLKKKRRYYTEIEYLESTGTQYIDTGIIADTEDYIFKASLKTISSDLSVIFGFLASPTGYPGILLNDAGTFRYGQTNAQTISPAFSTNTLYSIELSWKKLIVNGVEYTTTASTSYSNIDKSVYIFARNNDGKVGNQTKVKIYNFSIYKDALLIRDFIPVLDWDMTPCMYDKVSGQLFYNQGTGDFSYGREIHEVEYLESTGTQYIDTGIIGDLTTELTCEAAIVQAGNASVTNIMGNNVTNTRAITINMSANITSPSVSRIRFGDTNTTTVAGAIDLNTFYKYDTNKNELTVRDCSGIVLNTYPFNATTAFTTDGNILIYKIGDTFTQYVGNIKVKGSTIKNSGVLVRDFIPAIDENGVGYMFDRVSHTIYDNAGTGAFKYPARELEYIESDGNQYIDTGVILSSTDKVEASVEYTGEPTQGSSYAFGTFGSNKNFGINCTLKSNPKNWYGVWYNQGTLTSSSIFSGLNTRYDIQVSSNGMYINDNLLTTVSGTFTGSVSAYLFWAHGTGQPKSLMKLYSCKMWKSDVLVRDFIPCYKDGVLGMWDKINNVFYDNDGTGTFTKGKIVEPEYE